MRETLIGCLLYGPQQWVKSTRNPGMCPDRELNPQAFGVQDDAPTN